MKKTISLVLVLVLCLAIGELAQAATITIGPGADYDFETIQAGIDVSMDGDVVLVAPDEYVITEPITFRGKAITVVSETGPDETTIRMGTPADAKRGSVVIFENNETDSSILDGFTITGGTGYWLWFPEASESTWCGGGIYFNASSGTVRNCVIVQNSAKWAAGGVLAYSVSIVTLIDCTIADNTAGGADTTAGGAGGVSCCYDSSVTMTNCTIENNTAVDHGGGVSSAYGGSSITMNDCIVRANTAIKGLGGGVICGADNSSVTMTGCTIADNKSGEWSGGGVACLHNGSVSASQCTITGNTARQAGGGMLIFDQSSATVSNCIIAQNRAITIGGGGIWCGQSSTTTVTNSIIWGNTAPQGDELSVRKWSTGNTASTLTISYCNVGGGKAEVNVESGCTLDWGVGNIDADPYFVDSVNDDFHLKSQAGRLDPESQAWIQDEVTSPCIDAGDPMSPIGWEPFPNGGFVNMGAYGGTSKASKSYFGEPVCETIVAGDINGDGKVDRVDLEIMALHWTGDEPLPLP
jgi:parallel beta-helix repeat protein